MAKKKDRQGKPQFNEKQQQERNPQHEAHPRQPHQPHQQPQQRRPGQEFGPDRERERR